jgi:hypothetical protein
MPMPETNGGHAPEATPLVDVDSELFPAETFDRLQV